MVILEIHSRFGIRSERKFKIWVSAQPRTKKHTSINSIDRQCKKMAKTTIRFCGDLIELYFAFSFLCIYFGVNDFFPKFELITTYGADVSVPFEVTRLICDHTKLPPSRSTGPEAGLCAGIVRKVQNKHSHRETRELREICSKPRKPFSVIICIFHWIDCLFETDLYITKAKYLIV